MSIKTLILSLLLFLPSQMAGADEENCACGEPQFDSYAGTWESSYGHMYFTYRTSKGEIPSTDAGKGIRAAFWSYQDSHGMADNGRLVGFVSDRTFSGYWIQDSGQNPCATEKEGSPFWGIARFEANAEFTELSGEWGYCDEEPAGDDKDWVLWRDEIRDWNPPQD